MKKYGVEIETLSPVNALSLPRGWQNKHECTVRTTAERPYGREWVSPILDGADGIRQVATVVDTLAAADVSTNASCGMHVHVGASDFQTEHIGMLVALGKRYEIAFFSATAGARIEDRLSRSHGQSYCAASKYWQSGTRPYGRHLWMSAYNWHNCQQGYGSKNTIEFRVFASTVVKNHAIGAVMMSRALCEAAQRAVGDEGYRKSLKVRGHVHQNPAEAMGEFWERFLGPDGVLPCENNDIRDEMMRQATRAQTALVAGV